MAIKLDTFSSAGGGAGTDNLDDVTSRGATTTNAITVGGVSVGTAYTLPAVDGGSNTFLKTDGAGNLSFSAVDVTGGLVYQGAFNATTGLPSIANAEKGDFYVIDTAGTIYGQTWAVGDHLLINEDMGGSVTNSKIDKIDNTDQVTSVNGNTGVVVLSGDDLAADHTATNYTAANANIDGHFSGIDTALGTVLNPTLDDVTTNGNTTTNDVAVGQVTVSGDILANADATHTIGAEATRFISYYGDMNGAIRFKAKNDNGSAISKGQAVYINGVNGTVPTVALAQANSAATMPAFGLALTNANDQAEVQVISFGNLTNYNTTTYSLSFGDAVYVSAASAGALTNTAPTSETNLIQNIGTVVRAHGSDGIIKVGGAGRSAATPNLDQDKIFLGNASNQAVSTALSSVNLSSFNDDLTYPVTSVNTLTGAVVVSGNDIVADHTATNYTAANANVDGHLSGIDTKFGTLGTASTEDTGTAIGDVVLLENVGGIAGLPAVDGSQLTNLPSAPVTSVNTLTGAVVVSGNDIVADHTATNYTAANANVDGHLSGIDTKFGTLGTASTQDVGTSANNVVQLDGTAKLPAVDGSQLTNLPSAPVTSVNTLTGAVVVSGNDIAADHTAVNYTAANANVDGHFSGVDTKLGTLLSDITNESLNDLSDVSYTAGPSIDNYVLTYDNSTSSWGAEAASGGGGSVPSVTTDSSGTDTTISTNTGIEEIHLINNSSNNVVITIPAASTVGSGYKYNIKRLGAGTVSVSPSSGTIDANASFSLASQYDSVSVVSDGTNYHII